jgi:hypothetical protein
LRLKEQNFEAAMTDMKRKTDEFNSDPAIMIASNEIMTKELQSLQGQRAANGNAGHRSGHFQRVGHALFALLAGLVGGIIAL